MATLYYKRIKAEKMTLEEVPKLWYNQVKLMLEADNYE